MGMVAAIDEFSLMIYVFSALAGVGFAVYLVSLFSAFIGRLFKLFRIEYPEDENTDDYIIVKADDDCIELDEPVDYERIQQMHDHNDDEVIF